jgi:hypothetical protein
MPDMGFPACHIRTPYPDEAPALTAWSVFVAEQDGKPVGFVARPLNPPRRA